ncbi:MAG: ATP-binding protein [Cytophagales bacterium]
MARLCFLLLFFTVIFTQVTTAQSPKNETDIKKLLQQYDQKIAEGDRKEASRWLNEAAAAHWERKEYIEAIELFKKSLKLNEELGNQSGASMLHNNLGMIYSDLRDFETSLFHFQKTLDTRRKFKDKTGIQSGLINTSVVLNNLGWYQESIQNLKEALDLAREMNDAELMRSCYGMLAETYEKSGDAANTLKYFNFYRSFHELVQNSKVKKIEKTLEVKTLELLQLENEKQRQELELLKAGQKIASRDIQILSLDKEYQDLYDKSTKKEIIMQLIKEKDRIEKEKLNAELASQKHKEQIYLFTTAGSVFLIIVLGIAIFFFQKNIKYKEKMNIVLKERNFEIIRQKEQIEVQKEALNETNKLKDKLFSVLAHDLRSPFATLESLMMLYELNAYDQEQTKTFFLQVRSLSNSTLQTLENTLDWVKSQMSNGYRYEPMFFSLKNLTQEVIMFLSEIAKSKKIDIHNSISDSIEAYSDINQVRIVIRNLISNAIKFTNEGGKIIVNASIIANNKIAISIADTGVGIPADKIHKLFNTNSHFTTQGTQHEKGTGLGLLLSKELVEKNGGKITVQSAVNEGTTFTFTLNSTETMAAFN